MSEPVNPFLNTGPAFRKPFMAGKTARVMGETAEDCPYAEDDSSREIWLTGFNHHEAEGDA